MIFTEVKMNLKSLPPNKRPREKLENYGPSFLKNYELLAVILGKGNRKEDVMSISSRVMSQFWSNPALFNEGNVHKIMDIFSISYIQACQLVSVFELGRRIFGRRESIFLRNPEEVYKYVQNMSKNTKEVLRGLYLNARNKLIWDEIISIGTLNSSSAHPREIIAPAIEYKAVAFILIHNHPSGDVYPSEEDHRLTLRIYKSAKIFEIDFLDHLIIGEDSYYSFRKRSNIWK